jgi:ParB-like chromosome segregation protein Spo0J
MEIQYIKGSDLTPATWRSTYILRPDLKVLQKSMEEYGWLQPIIVQAETNVIIDGFHRAFLAGSVKSIKKRDKGLVPVHFVDCDELEAMLMHLRLNRGRGAQVGKGVSSIVKALIKSRAIDQAELRDTLAMSREEFDLMLDGTLLKQRKVDQHSYSKAWIPIEAPAGAAEQKMSIEKPPNADR